MTAPPLVEVLEETRVAGLDATVLRASDPEALSAWLGEHGYEDRPALVEWLAPYVEEGYAITAFRFEKSAESESDQLGSEAVRMTFETDRPFYPYREPSDHPEEPWRALWLHVIATERASGVIDGEWAPETIFAAPVEDPAALLGDSLSDVSGDLWLTTIIDRSSVRADADLFFDVARGEEVRPPPRVITETKTLWLPIEPLLLGGVGIWWWRRRKRRAAPQ